MIATLTKATFFNASLIIAASICTGLAIAGGNYIFWSPFICISIWAWIRFATKYPAEALIIVIFFAEEGFDIFTFGMRQRFLSDIAIFLMLSIILFNVNRVRLHIVSRRTPYAKAILVFFIVIFISQYFGAMVKFGQPLDVGLIVARKYLLICSYFFLVAVGATKDTCYRLLEYLAWLGTVIAILSIVDVALGGGAVFSKYYAIGQERAGQLRIHVGTFLIVYSVIYSFIKFQSRQGASARLICFTSIAVGLYTLIFIILTRAVFLGLFLTLLFWFAYHTNSRKVTAVCFSTALIAVFALSGIFDHIMTESFLGQIIEMTRSEIFSDKGTIPIRIEGALYYLNLTLENAPLTGIGIFSGTNYPNNPVTFAAEMYHYLPVDINGLTTIIFFGLQGLILLAFFSVKALRDCISAIHEKARSEKYHFEILLLIIIYTLATPTLNNLITESMSIYSGIFFYLFALSSDSMQGKAGRLR